MKTRRQLLWAWALAALLAGGGDSLCAQGETGSATTNETASTVTNEAEVASTPETATTGKAVESDESPEPESTGTPTSRGFASFAIISDRNIFNGNRSGQVIRSTRSSSQQRSVQIDSFTLVGTLISEKGPVAFFDGSESDYRKVLKPGESVAGFQVKEILPAGVRLQEGTNKLDLRVGSGMRREDRGLWKYSASGATYASSSSSYSGSGYSGGYSGDNSSRSRNSRNNDRNRGRGAYSRNESPGSSGSATTLPAAEVSEVLKRLMERRANSE